MSKAASHGWTEVKVARVLARNTFSADLCVLPNCTWTGDEIDLLVVTMTRRVIDVEIKISRADLKADAKKSKWWRHMGYDRVDGKLVERAAQDMQWPRKVWKHYYAMPAEIWCDDLRAAIPKASGVLLVHAGNAPRINDAGYGNGRVECVKRSTPCKTADALSDTAVVQIARLASLRMWDAYKAADRLAEELNSQSGAVPVMKPQGTGETGADRPAASNYEQPPGPVIRPGARLEAP